MFSSKFKIRFIIFDTCEDIHIINKLIEDCQLTHNYEIISKDNCLDIINEIVKNEKHLCLRFHAHVICYLYKLQFISFPLTNKTKQFNKDNNIRYSFEHNEMLNLITNQSIEFKDLTFNYEILNNFFKDKEFKTKLLTTWTIYNEIYTNFINIFNNKNKITSNNIYYITDQIEFNILGYLNSPFRYGINEKIKLLLSKYTTESYHLQNEFITILTGINST
jgi:hypothetical protein